MALSEDTALKEETWIDWIKRVTGIVEAHADKAHVRDWVQEQRKRKWRWAGHIMRMHDGRWTRQVLR